ncbi:zinc finger protein 808-like isoform X2 [Leptidea sinapis]|uniref:zinc finger protein 808-like isoform X2 n=1 Tax=Leptidea sinapis TaxID=189913 RepID=UPI0021C3BE32|nr:zinc finger protein 808-like isoform X2 [Leptidea sinapis]
MASENEVWKIENDLCRCCHNEGKFVNLVEPRIYLNQKEVYGEMLKDCFSIDIKPVPGVLCASTYTICDMCITQLRDAISFQKQILHCEKKFLDLYEKNAIKAKTEIIVKTEVDIEIEDDAKQNDSLMSFDEDDYSPEEDIEYELKIENESDDDQPLVPKKRPKANPKPVPKPEPVSSKKPDSGGAKKKKEGGNSKHIVIKVEDDTKWFACSVCDYKVKTQRTLEEHIEAVHNYVKCEYCDEKVEMNRRLSHYEAVHDKVMEICDLCEHLFDGKVHLDEHRKICAIGDKDINKIEDEKGVKYACRICDFRSKVRKTTLSHMRSRHAFTNCQICKLRLRREQLHLHNMTVHSIPIPRCNVCGQVFNSENKLSKHQENVCHNAEIVKKYSVLEEKGKKKYACNMCPLKLDTCLSIIRHVSRVHSEFVSCALCKVKIMRTHIAAHKEKEHGMKSPACGVCGRVFNSKSKMEKHQQVAHMGESNYKCPHCPKSFRWKTNLTYHLNIHLGIKNYACDRCDAKFVQPNSLNYHMKKHHPS